MVKTEDGADYAVFLLASCAPGTLESLVGNKVMSDDGTVCSHACNLVIECRAQRLPASVIVELRWATWSHSHPCGKKNFMRKPGVVKVTENKLKVLFLGGSLAGEDRTLEKTKAVLVSRASPGSSRQLPASSHAASEPPLPAVAAQGGPEPGTEVTAAETPEQRLAKEIFKNFVSDNEQDEELPGNRPNSGARGRCAAQWPEVKGWGLEWRAQEERVRERERARKKRVR